MPRCKNYDIKDFVMGFILLLLVWGKVGMWRFPCNEKGRGLHLECPLKIWNAVFQDVYALYKEGFRR